MGKLRECPGCGSSGDYLDVHILANNFHHWVQCARCGFTGGAKETLESAVAAWNTRASGWIDCKDRLPEEDGRYLACTESEKVYIATFVTTGTGKRAFLKGDRWQKQSSNITHWQPLPEPPHPVLIGIKTQEE